VLMWPLSLDGLACRGGWCCVWGVLAEAGVSFGGAGHCWGWGQFSGGPGFLLCFVVVVPVAECSYHVDGCRLAWCEAAPVCGF